MRTRQCPPTPTATTTSCAQPATGAVPSSRSGTRGGPSTLTTLLNAVMRANFSEQPVASTLLVAGVAILLTVRETQRQGRTSAQEQERPLEPSEPSASEPEPQPTPPQTPRRTPVTPPAQLPQRWRGWSRWSRNYQSPHPLSGHCVPLQLDLVMGLRGIAPRLRSV